MCRFHCVDTDTAAASRRVTLTIHLYAAASAAAVVVLCGVVCDTSRHHRCRVVDARASVQQQTERKSLHFRMYKVKYCPRERALKVLGFVNA